MKRKSVFLLIMFLSISLTACAKSADKVENNENQNLSDPQQTTEQIKPKNQKTMIMVIDEKEILVSLNDTPEATALYESLPMELTFEDYNGSEKIAYLPNDKELQVNSSTEAYDPSIGDLCFFAPWGNLCLFYQEQGIAKGLLPLGHIESDWEVIANINDETVISLKQGN